MQLAQRILQYLPAQRMRPLWVFPLVVMLRELPHVANGQPSTQPIDCREAVSSFWVAFAAVFAAVGTAAAFFAWGYHVGRESRRAVRESGKATDRAQKPIDALMRWLHQACGRLVSESFSGPKKAAEQLWLVQLEWERLELWLPFYVTQETDRDKVRNAREAILDSIGAADPMEIDKVFLKHIADSDALFSCELRDRCSRMLAQRLTRFNQSETARPDTSPPPAHADRQRGDRTVPQDGGGAVGGAGGR